MMSQVCCKLRLLRVRSINRWLQVERYVHDNQIRKNLLITVIRGLCDKSIQHQCWRCGADVQNIGVFCHRCNTLQKPDGKTNYFDIFEIEHEYEIENKELTTKYRKLQNVLHPDRFSSKSEEEREISEQYSALVNKAYSTLIQPLARGLYMLRLHGLHLEEETDPQFLAEIMEANEELADAEHPDEVRRLDRGNRSTIDTLAREVGIAFSAGDIGAAKLALVKMKYYSSIGARIKDLKQKTGLE